MAARRNTPKMQEKRIYKNRKCIYKPSNYMFSLLNPNFMFSFFLINQPNSVEEIHQEIHENITEMNIWLNHSRNYLTAGLQIIRGGDIRTHLNPKKQK
jgi:hypothetical protein